MQTLADLTTWPADADGVHRGAIADGWGQGRAAFGGYVASAAVRAAGAHAPADRPLRSALVHFVAPARVGPAAARVEVLRDGGSMTHVQTRIEQDGRPACVVLSVFGAARPTRVPVAAPPPPDVPPPDGLGEMPFARGIVPDFIQHYALRWTVPHVPYAGGDVAHVQGWLRPRARAPLHAADLLALVDTWPPPVMALADRPAPGSTVTWQVNLVRDLPPEGAPGDAWWLFDGRTTHAEGGHADCTGALWDAAGNLVATSRQLVAEFTGR